MTDHAEPQTSVGLRQYVGAARRRYRVIVAVTAAAVGTAVALSVTQTPVYKATMKIVVGQGNSLFAPSVSYAVQPLTATMGNLVKSNIVATRVIEGAGLRGETPQSLLRRVTVVVDPTTSVIQVDVRDHSKARAVTIAERIGVVFSDLVRERFGSAAGPPTTGTPTPTPSAPLSATVFDPAHALTAPVSPKPLRNAVIAFFLGLVLGLIAAFLREHVDNKLRDREAVESAFGLPVIGQVPFVRMRDGAPPRHVVLSGHAAEPYRALRANLQYLGVKRPLRTILVTSGAPSQGKTTVTANLAVAIASSGASIVAVEGDLRRPELAKALGCNALGRGLTNVLVGTGPLEEELLEVPIADLPTGSVATVSLLPSGALPPNPSELLSSQQMRDVLDRLTGLYHHVVIDSPPLLLVSDPLELASMVDGVVLVARRDDATTDEAREIRAIAERLDLPLLGVVLTDTSTPELYYGAYEPAGTPRRAGEREPVADF
jgi:capsular exopolysaccharide synthesis family protein